MFANMKMKFRLVVTDTKTGKPIRRTRWRNSHSFVIQFLQMLQGSMEHAYAGTNSYAMTDTGNTSRTVAIGINSGVHYSGYHWSLNAPVDGDTYGIVVGTDNTAETNTDYVLGTQIADGSGAGQLDYSSHTWTDAAEVGANVDMYVQRPFINNSGGGITIEETGIYVTVQDSGATQRYFCIVRDTTGGVTVNDGQTCTVEYLFRTTV